MVQLSRLRDGRRVVSQITEIEAGHEGEGGVRTKDLFLLETVGGKPLLCPTGALPTFMGELISAGKLQLEAFYRA